MNVHKNARLTPRGRALMVSRIVDEGWSVVAAAEASGVSERTARKWLGRHRRGPNEGFTDRSSAPRRCPRRVAPRRVTEIERLRRQRMSGPQIAASLGTARSTVGLVLRRLGLGRLSALDPKPPASRYERAAPGANGPTPGPTAPPSSEAQPFSPGSTTTTSADLTRASDT